MSQRANGETGDAGDQFPVDAVWQVGDAVVLGVDPVIPPLDAVGRVVGGEVVLDAEDGVVAADPERGVIAEPRGGVLEDIDLDSYVVALVGLAHELYQPSGLRVGDQFQAVAQVVEAHHVEVQHADDTIAALQGLGGVAAAAPQPQLLARPGDEADGPGKSALGKKSGTLQHQGHARTVVIGARGGVGAPVPAAAGAGADGVVVGADNVVPGIRIGAGQFADDVVHEGVVVANPKLMEADGLRAENGGEPVADVAGRLEGLGPAGVAGAKITRNAAGRRIYQGQGFDVCLEPRGVHPGDQVRNLGGGLQGGGGLGRPKGGRGRQRVALWQGPEEVLLPVHSAKQMHGDSSQSPTSCIEVDQLEALWQGELEVVGEEIALARPQLVLEKEREAQISQVRTQIGGASVDEGHTVGHVAERSAGLGERPKLTPMVPADPQEVGSDRPGQSRRSQQQE